ncbi:MAG: Gldg family protein [Planctomycetota bacterium]|nr:Gldg family protein [Planctomycetota bacterium]
MRGALAVARRELAALAAAPTALVFLLAFSALTNLSVLGMERLFDRGQADLEPLFAVLPWLGLLLLPALSMGLWSEERRSGSLELLLSLPLPTASLVVGKFLASLAFAGLALAGTFGLWIAVARFGEPDHGALLAGYLGSLLLFSAFLSIGSFVSALTRSQATAFVLSVAVGFVFLFSDVPAIGAVVEELGGSGAPALLASLSLSAHFEAITRGVLGASDLAFFVSLSAAFLGATVLCVDGRRRDRRPLAELSLCLVGLVAFNLLATPLLGRLRLDCTSDGLYTLDPSSRAIARSLPEGTRLQLYLSQEAAATSPRFLGFAEFVGEVLDDLERASRGRLTIERIDPAPLTDAEDRALAAGLTFVPLGVHGGGRELCFGAVAIGPEGDQRSLPFLAPEREQHLEAELARLLLEVAHPERKRVGVLGSADIVPELLHGGLQGRGWQVVDAARARFDFRELPLDTTAVPADIDVLWVVHPEQLAEPTARAIHRFALAGGALLLQVDPLAEADRGQMTGEDEFEGYIAERESGLPNLLRAWGLELVPRKVVVDRTLGRRLPAGAGGLQEAATNVHWLSAAASAFGDSRLLGGLGELGLFTPGELRPLADVDPPSGLEREPLLSSSGDSMLLDVSEVQVRVDPRELLASIVPGGDRQVLAWRVHGLSPWPEILGAVGGGDRFQSFRAGSEGQPEAEGTEADPVASAPMTAIVLADVDLLADGLWISADERDGQVVGMRPYADNGPLIETLLAELAGGAELASVGPRARYTRPFSRFVELERSAEERLARELGAARALEAELQAALLASEEALTSSGVRPDPAAASALREDLAVARRDLRALTRDRDAEVQALKRRAVLWNVLGFPLFVLLGAGLRGLTRRS